MPLPRDDAQWLVRGDGRGADGFRADTWRRLATIGRASAIGHVSG